MSASTSPDIVASRLKSVLETSPLAMAFVQGDRFTAVSEAMNQLFGHGDDTELVGQTTRVLQVSDAAHAGFYERLAEALSAGYPLDDEVELVRRNGSRFWARVQASAVDWDTQGSELIWLVQDVTQARLQRLQPAWSERHDAVTELVNRRELVRHLSDHVGSRRTEPVSLLWLDIDSYMHVQAQMGPDAGKQLLIGVAHALRGAVRVSDVIARIENDCFAVLLPACDQHYAEIIGDKLRAAVSSYRLRWGPLRARVKACVGVVQLQAALPSVDAVLAAAAEACAQAKAAGGDSVRVYAPTAGAGA